jgi:hypothetical protein
LPVASVPERLLEERAMASRVSALIGVAVALSLPSVGGHRVAAAGTAGKPARASAMSKAWTPPRTLDGHPDLQGVWAIRSLTPLQRPSELAGKAVLTEEEAAAYQKMLIERGHHDLNRKVGTNDDVRGAYNQFWYDAKALNETRRTSLISDPPDGLVPARTPEGRQREALIIPASGFQDPRLADSWEDRGLWERCLTRGLPDMMLPGSYNDNYQIFQTKDYVVIHAEMIHDARIIPLDGRPHVGSNIRQWLGDSRGRWEGQTLVVETTNFSGKTNYWGSREHLRLVERFTRLDAETINYEVTVTDPTTFTRPWTITLPVKKNPEKMFEYACHEGNYAMMNLLKGSRVAEKAVRSSTP